MNKQDQQFRGIMKNYRPRKAPVDFSKRVMDEIHSLPVLTKVKPIFGKWFLPLAVAVLVVFISVTFLLWGETGTKPGNLSTTFARLPKADLQVLDNASQSFIGWFEQIPVVLVLALAGVIGLLLLDRYLGKHYYTRKA